MGDHHIEKRRVGRVHIGRWAAVAVLATGIGFLLLGGVAGSDSSFTVTQGDFELTCPAGTIAESATLTCTLKNTAAEAKPWPAVAILHLSTDTDRALVRGSSIDVTLGTPSPDATIDGGVTWIGDTLVGYSRFDWTGNAGADPTQTTTTVGAPGNSRTVNIVATHDSLDENNERFYVALGPDGSKGVGILYNNKTSVTLTDDDGPSTDKSLSSLQLLAGQSYTLSPTQATQSQTVGYQVTEATLTAAAARGTTMAVSASFDGSSADLDGRGGTSIDVISGQESAAVPLAVGTNTVALTVTAEDGTTTGTHTVSIVRSALGAGVETVAVSVPSFTLTCPAEVVKGTDAQCTLRASGAADWPVVAVIHSSADGASRALVAEDPIIPDTDPNYSKDVSLGAQQPARTAFNRGYGELFSGGSRTLYRTYGYEKFDWSGAASAGATRTVTIQLHDSDANSGGAAEVFYVALAPSGYTGLSQLVDNKVPVLLTGLLTVTGVEVVSSAAVDGTYAMGDVISLRVTFSEAVNVTGTPTLGIDMDPAPWGRKDAAYSGGSGTTELTFAYEVVQPNYSSQGIAVLADTLALNGGTIQTADGTDAELDHTGLGHDPAHKVDWQQNRPPVFAADSMSLQVEENTASATALGGSMAAADADNGAVLTFTLGGADAWGFTIDSATGQISISGALDFEAPADSDGDNVYELSVSVSDGLDGDWAPDTAADDTMAVSVEVLDVDEWFQLWCHPAQPYDAANQRWTLVEPQLSHSGRALWPDTLIAGHCWVIDPEGAQAAYSVSGDDADMFEISVEGVLSFATAPDFEVPADSDNDNVYEVAVTATVGGHTSPVSLAVAVTDGPETPVTIITLPEPDPDGNQPPVFSGTSVTHDHAVPGTLVSLELSKDDFSDPEGEALTFRLIANRDDVAVPDGYGYIEDLGRIWFRAKTACALKALGATASGIYDTEFTLLAFDPDGAVGHATATFRTDPDEYACPTVSAAAVDGATLTIALAADGTLPPSFRRPTADEFEIKADGAAVALAATGAVAATDTEIVLSLASPVTAGQTITVTYTSGDDPMAAAFSDQAVTNKTAGSGNTAEPDCTPDPDGPMTPICAAVSGNELTLTFNRDLAAVSDTEAVTLRQYFLVNGAHHNGLPVANQSPSQVAVDGATVTLTLGTAVQPGDDVTVSYFGGLQESDDTPVAAFATTLPTTQRD